MVKKQRLINILMGDTSFDGHEKIEKFIVSTDSSVEEIQKAYLLGEKIIGVDITSQCTEYEQNNISIEEMKKINKWLCPKLSDNTWITTDDFFRIWLRTVQLGNPTINIEVIKISESIDIGGYGLLF